MRLSTMKRLSRDWHLFRILTCGKVLMKRNDMKHEKALVNWAEKVPVPFHCALPLLAVSVLLMAGCLAEKPSSETTVVSNNEPAQSAAPPPTKPEAPATRPSGYGKEEHRLVEQPDEIVSVLKNGAVVIAKRVPSPVVAVR